MSMGFKDYIFEVLTYLFKDVLFSVIKGTIESFKGIVFLHIYYKKPNEHESDSKGVGRRVSKKPRSRDRVEKKDLELCIRTEIYRCCFYNGITYGASCFAFNYIFLPLFNFLLYNTLSQSMAEDIWNIAYPTLSCLFDTLWTVPIFLLFKIINTFWFQDIANSAYRQRHGRPQAFSISGFGSQISDTVFSVVIETLFLVQASLMQFVPYPSIAVVLSCLHLSMLNSLYCFEYLWCNKGWTFHKRITYIEANWPYFTGFGLPLFLVTFSLPSVLAGGFVYSVFFPLFIISAIEAPPLLRDSVGPSLKLFSFVVWFSSLITRKAFSSDVKKKVR